MAVEWAAGSVPWAAADPPHWLPRQVKGFGALRKAGAGVAGNEGLGVVMSVGSGVTDLKKDDFVVPSGAGFGA